MKNLYKSTDIFKCVHESHKGYKNKISVYHILKEKTCYPDGCIYFRWKCKILNKKSRCSRGFSHVGRKCFGCREFYEEKIHNYPELQIKPENYQQFLNELDEFEDWINDYKYKPINFWGKVASIKPNFIQKVSNKSKFLSFRGFIIVLKDVYLENQLFEDPVYALISSHYYMKLRFGTDGELEGLGQLRIDRGRLVLRQLRKIEINYLGQPPFWNDEKVILSRKTAVEFNNQPENCIKCQFGALIEQEISEIEKSAPRRKLYCLKGMSDYRNCFVPVEFCSGDLENHTLPNK